MSDTITMIGRDAINPANIPVEGTQYAYGYANGRISQWPANGWDRFPAARHVRIDVDGSAPHADELDVELYDATPTTARDWTREKLDLRGPNKPSIYCNRSTRPIVKSILGGVGLTAGIHYGFRIATLDGTKLVEDMNEIIAVQYTDMDNLYDESIVYETTWLSGGITPTARYQEVGTYPEWDGTLWGIAQHYYGDGNKWETIYAANAKLIGPNPNDLRPGMDLRIP